VSPQLHNLLFFLSVVFGIFIDIFAVAFHDQKATGINMNVSLAVTESHISGYRYPADDIAKDPNVTSSEEDTKPSPPSDRDECRTPVSGNRKSRKHNHDRKSFLHKRTSARAEPDASDGAQAPDEALRHRMLPEDEPREGSSSDPMQATETQNTTANFRFDYAYHNPLENSAPNVRTTMEQNETHQSEQRRIVEHYKHDVQKSRLPPVPGAYHCSTLYPLTVPAAFTSSLSNDVAQDLFQNSSNLDNGDVQFPQSAFSTVPPSSVRDNPSPPRVYPYAGLKSPPVPAMKEKTHSSTPDRSAALHSSSENALKGGTARGHSALVSEKFALSQSLPDAKAKANHEQSPSESLAIPTNNAGGNHHLGALHAARSEHVNTDPDAPVSVPGSPIMHSTVYLSVNHREKAEEWHRRLNHDRFGNDRGTRGLLSSGIVHYGLQCCDDGSDNSDTTSRAVAVSSEGLQISQRTSSLSAAPVVLEPRDPEQQVNEQQSQGENNKKKRKLWTGPRTILVAGTAFVTIGTAVVLGLILGNRSSSWDDPVSTDPPTTMSNPVAEAVFQMHIVNQGITNLTQFEDPLSPQSSAKQWLLQQDNFVKFSEKMSSAQIDQMITRYVLAVFYYSMHGERWFGEHNWLDGNLDHCDWALLACGDEGRILPMTKISAVSNPLTAIKVDPDHTLKLDGTLPYELVHLPFLDVFSLPNNQIKDISVFAEGPKSISTFQPSIGVLLLDTHLLILLFVLL
jgi:hypothetical protein